MESLADGLPPDVAKQVHPDWRDPGRAPLSGDPPNWNIAWHKPPSYQNRKRRQHSPNDEQSRNKATHPGQPKTATALSSRRAPCHTIDEPR